MRLVLAALLMSSAAIAAPKKTSYRVSVGVYQKGVEQSGSTVLIKDGLKGSMRSETGADEFTDFGATVVSIPTEADKVDVDLEFSQKHAAASSQLKTHVRLHTRQDELIPVGDGTELHVKIEPL